MRHIHTPTVTEAKRCAGGPGRRDDIQLTRCHQRFLPAAADSACRPAKNGFRHTSPGHEQLTIVDMALILVERLRVFQQIIYYILLRSREQPSSLTLKGVGTEKVAILGSVSLDIPMISHGGAEFILPVKLLVVDSLDCGLLLGTDTKRMKEEML